MARLKRGQKMVCIPCGREVVISDLGVSESAVWCCGRPMKAKGKRAAKKKTSRKRKR